jgi:hypothetical protein
VSNDEDTITRKDLLQINAILITGILIFLSVYGEISSKVIGNNTTDGTKQYLISISTGLFLTSFALFLASIGLLIDKERQITVPIRLVLIGLGILLLAMNILLSGLFGQIASYSIIISLFFVVMFVVYIIIKTE